MPYTSYLPQVQGNTATVTQGQGDAQPTIMTPHAQQFADAWLGFLGERAKVMRPDTRLIKCAQDHADWSAPRLGSTESGHIGRDGSTPNMRVRAAGYRLLDWHKDGNTVESSKRTWEDLDTDMEGVVSRLMAHVTHHDHMWGLNWYKGHTVYGIGSAGEPSGSTYFVCLICPPEE